MIYILIFYYCTTIIFLSPNLLFLITIPVVYVLKIFFKWIFEKYKKEIYYLNRKKWQTTIKFIGKVGTYHFYKGLIPLTIFFWSVICFSVFYYNFDFLLSSCNKIYFSTEHWLYRNEIIPELHKASPYNIILKDEIMYKWHNNFINRQLNNNNFSYLSLLKLYTKSEKDERIILAIILILDVIIFHTSIFF